MSCLINDTVHDSIHEKNECGFMGATHALSGVALFLAAIAWIPEITFKVLGTSNPWVVILAVILTAGGALLPDLDNTRSTSKSALGPLGSVLSSLFRASAIAIQTVIRTKRDDPTPNAHRGWWHTVPAALLLGGAVYAGTRVGGSLTLPFINQEISYGKLIGILFAWLLLHISLEGLIKDSMKKIKKSSVIGEAIALFMSLAIILLVLANIPKDIDFWWLGVSIALGMIIHVLGDCCTTAGAPILFPLSAKLKGKFWWKTRFSSMKAGGEAEQYIFGIFVVLSLVSLAKIFGLF